MNLVDWLAHKESFTGLDKAAIQLDQPTALLDMEIPQNSTEPKPEPWTAPVPGYKWWDPSTFKPGSYASD